MKTSRTLLFIVSVFLMMGLIGYAIPPEGIKIADTTITFPTLADMVEPDVPQIDSTQAFLHAEQMRRFMEVQRASEEMQRRFAVTRHRYAINFPHDSIEWIYPLFQALENASKHPLRILHYGDSQIEVDRITSDLRQNFMNRFGGYGVGLIPAIQTIPTSAISQDCDVELTRYMVYGLPKCVSTQPITAFSDRQPCSTAKPLSILKAPGWPKAVHGSSDESPYLPIWSKSP